MINTSTEGLYRDEGVWVSPSALAQFGAFEKDYLQVRGKEQRIFSIDEIRQLPQVPAGYLHAAEWKMRVGSINRFMHYLKNRKPGAATIIDIGCGNGFFANTISAYAGKVYGVDVNLRELQQAATAFEDNPKLQWYYLDIFDEHVFEEADADLVTFCCSFQYFKEIDALIHKCKRLLKPGGSIHIIDTPFYPEQDRDRARAATARYYDSLGCGSLAQHYCHHSLEQIKAYDPVIRYRPASNFLTSLFRKNDSPFPWIEIRKQ